MAVQYLTRKKRPFRRSEPGNRGSREVEEQIDEQDGSSRSYKVSAGAHVPLNLRTRTQEPRGGSSHVSVL